MSAATLEHLHQALGHDTVDGSPHVPVLPAEGSTIHALNERGIFIRARYTISMDDASTIQANCTEGGAVIIYKKSNRWERVSAVFPKRLDPLMRSVAEDRETALRAGCRGVDYQN